MSKQYEIDSNFVLSLFLEYDGVNICVTNKYDVLDLCHFDTYFIKNKLDEYIFKQRVVEKIDNLINDFNIDTFILEENKLLIDKIDKYPDPYVMRNKLLDYSLQVTLEDKYLHKIKYYIVLPHYEWFTTLLNKNARYEIDLYKSHILEHGFRGNDTLLEEFNSHNYYRALCLAECVDFDNLMNKKYQINYERGGS